MPPESHRWEPKVIALAICLLGFALLLYQLGEKSLWTDERFTADVVQGDLGSLVRTVARDVHPPLYFLYMRAWVSVAGNGELALRFPSAVFGILSLAMLYRLGAEMTSKRVGLLAMGLMAVSPFFVLYSRMARYYSLVLLLTLLSYWFFSQLQHRGTSRASWLGYIASSTLAIYTFYPAAFVLAAQALVVFARIGSRRELIPRFFAVQALIICCLAPWLGVVIEQAAGLRATGDLFKGSSLTMWLLSAVYPAFAWTVGETINPWSPAALAGVILATGLGTRGLLAAMKAPGQDLMGGWGPKESATDQVGSAGRPSPTRLPQSLWTSQGLAFLAFIFLPLSLGIVTIRVLVTYEAFITVPSRSIYCVPFIYLVMAAGIRMIRRPRARLLVVAILGTVVALSLRNYYAGREFHNPFYVLPTRSSAKMIVEQGEPGDVFISDYTTTFGFYLTREDPSAIHFRADDPQAAINYIERHHTRRIWLILLCRAVETESRANVELVPWLLREGYSPELSFGYGPIDENYVRLQDLVLTKPACRYKVIVHRYARPQRELQEVGQQ